MLLRPCVGHDSHHSRDVFRAFAKLVCRTLHLAVKRTVNPVRLSERSSDLIANHARNFGGDSFIMQIYTRAHARFLECRNAELGIKCNAIRTNSAEIRTRETVRNDKVNERYRR